VIKKSLTKSSLALLLAAGFALAPLANVPAANAAPGGLCASNSEYADEDWITTLKLGSHSPITSAQGLTYKDASATSAGTFAAGTSNAIELTVNVDLTDSGGDDWDEHVFVWLDTNQNGEVDLDNEEVFTANAFTSTFTNIGADPNLRTHTFTGTFDVPANAYNGTVYGRAMLQYVGPNESPYMCNSDPDGWDPGVSAFEAGTVLDFKVNLTGGIDNPELANTGTDNSTSLVIGASLLVSGFAVLALVGRRRRKSL